MKRFIPVLALALILVLTGWDGAESKRYPEIRIDEVQYDHPWGGEQNDPDPPINYSATSTSAELNFFQIVKSWNYRLFFTGSSFWMIGSKGTENTTAITTTTTTTTTTQSSDNLNQTTSERGYGQ